MKITLHVVEPKINKFDHHYVDENGNKIASLLRNANGRGYMVLFYVNIPHYEPITVGSLMTGSYIIKKTLLENGCEIGNKFLP